MYVNNLLSQKTLCFDSEPEMKHISQLIGRP